MAKPTDWIGPFVAVELESAIAWCNSNKLAPNAADIIGSRFNDDRSHFTSTVQFSPSTHPWDPLAQISSVSCKDPLIIIITDGHTHIKAKLSDSARRTLERELEGEIGLGLKGDVFSIKETVVVSTPYGPADQHIQLEIQEIEYRYYLRKVVGPSKLILDRPGVGRLLTEIAEIRRQQFGVPVDNAAPQSTRANANANANAAAAGTSCPSGQGLTNESHSPQSQCSQLHSSPAASTQQSSGTQRAVATQVPHDRKRKTPPTLADDGFEIQQGSNLARPQGPKFSLPTTKPLPGKRRQLDNDQTGETLLGLLRNRPSDMQQSKVPPIDLPSQTSRESLRESPHAPTTTPGVSGGVEPMSIEGAEQTRDTTIDESVQEDKPRSLPAPPNYSLRRIPLDQRKLLEKQDSWVPSLPGKQLPHPNVPVQLLKHWHDKPSPEIEDDANVDSGAVEDATDTSNSSSEPSSDEELEWEATPSQKKPQLPPDSTMTSGANATPLRHRTQRPSGSSQSVSQALQQLPPDSSNDSTGRSPKVLKQTQARTQQPASSYNGSATHSSPVLKQTQQSLVTSPSPAVKKPQESAPASSKGIGSQKQHLRSKHRGAQRQKAPDTNKLGTGPRSIQTKNSKLSSANTPNQKSRPLSAGNIVKGTQLAGGDEMDMEMSVPRSIEEKDPIEVMRQKRRESLKRAQRMKWLKDNFKIDPYSTTLPPSTLPTLLSRYWGVYHTDMDCSRSEWAEAFQSAFPELYPDGTDTAQGDVIPKDKVAKPPANVRDSPMSADGVTMSNTNTSSAAGSLRALSSAQSVNPYGDPPSDTSSSSANQHWGYANPVAPDKDVEALPPPEWMGGHIIDDRHRPEWTPEFLRAERKRLDDQANEAEQRRGDEWVAEKKRERTEREKEERRKAEAEERRKRETEERRQAEAEDKRKSQGQGVYGEWKDAMGRVRPGGATAAPAAPAGAQQGGRASGAGRGGNGRGGARGRGRHAGLNVLDWNL